MESLKDVELVGLLSKAGSVLNRTPLGNNSLTLGTLDPHLQNGDNNAYVIGNFMGI